ncbi:alpha/beta hydrolase family protein [Cyclobacterium plantarum]|uniref:Prolyl oligopeptidase family serine peptidase n=1 Tax=Cyclobacterium plantarum TaxID=2716263 RepID=A0ABX0H5B6_9BACT|nr:prolyl oligopeptidase family serine peptidase [Cyclobacterium plantarum]NHE55563.1 prolyl oligopeptidase family serine peptidase [Cyclobacterium plantarum]
MNRKKSVVLVLLTVLIAITSCRDDKVFAEYEIKEFTFKGRDAKIVFPNKQNQNNYWIWRARFWGHEPQVDKALLENGFHLVYVDVSNLFGNNEAVVLWNEFYNHCISEYGLNHKVVLEGMSRGGLIIYNWASKNTDKVFCIYADAPVCDIKSWPGGMYSGSGSPEEWKLCLEAYSLDTISVKTFKDIPINNCVSIAKAGIPVLHVYGDADTVVPFDENTKLLAEKFKKAGGRIEIIRKEGVGHHPHSLKDPKPIVDFILKSIEQ